MTAKELHKHVSQWPEGAKPKDCHCHFFPEGDAAWCQEEEFHSQDQGITKDHAIALHVASGLEWLIDHGLVVWMNQEDGTHRVGRWNDNDSFTGPTIFHAIHAAILATKENA